MAPPGGRAHWPHAAGLLTGVLPIVWDYLRLVHQMRFVPQPVMAGFVNALGILIVLAQLPQLASTTSSVRCSGARLAAWQQPIH